MAHKCRARSYHWNAVSPRTRTTLRSPELARLECHQNDPQGAREWTLTRMHANAPRCLEWTDIARRVRFFHHSSALFDALASICIWVSLCPLPNAPRFRYICVDKRHHPWPCATLGSGPNIRVPQGGWEWNPTAVRVVD